MATNYLTPEALEQLKQELHYLKTDKRQEIAERLRESKELGDLSENAEYQETKEVQAQLEAKIQKLEELIKHSVVIKKNNNRGTRVEIGSTIMVVSLTPPRVKKKFIITGSMEAKPEEGRISNESPLGRAFLNTKKGDIVVVKTPNGEVKYKIEHIS